MTKIPENLIKCDLCCTEGLEEFQVVAYYLKSNFQIKSFKCDKQAFDDCETHICKKCIAELNKL